MQAEITWVKIEKKLNVLFYLLLSSYPKELRSSIIEIHWTLYKAFNIHYFITLLKKHVIWSNMKPKLAKKRNKHIPER